MRGRFAWALKWRGGNKVGPAAFIIPGGRRPTNFFSDFFPPHCQKTAMTDFVREMNGMRVLVCDVDGPILAHEHDTGAFMGLAWEQNAAMVAVPLSRLGGDFLDLKTRIAGDVIQKFVNYRLRLAIVGDVSARLARSTALRDFVREANRGQDVWFVDDLDDLNRRLVANPPRDRLS
jgi:hypothetical protein